MDNKIYKLTDQEFIDLVKSSTSEVLFKLIGSAELKFSNL